jgi:ABC-type uncharacterized transport system permease subunit
MTGKLLSVLRALAFVLLALALCGLVFELAGFSAPEMFQSIADGAFTSPEALMKSLRWAMPLLITACGVLVSFRCGYFNVGAQGQFYLGAIGATVAVEALDGAPTVLVVPAALAAGMAGGALWAAWPGFLRIRWGTDEVITTLMGNFLAGLLLVYLTSGPLKDPTGTGQVTASRPVTLSYRIATSVGVSPTIIVLTLATLVLVWLLVNRTAFGVLSSLAGRNPVMIVWQGAKLSSLGLSAFLVSGALAGLSGAIELLGSNGRLVSGFLPGHGFTAVLIALVAGLSVTGTAVVSMFFGGLAAASLYLPVIAGLPAAAIDVINAAIALFITARTFPLPTALLERLPARRPAP